VNISCHDRDVDESVPDTMATIQPTAGDHASDDETDNCDFVMTVDSQLPRCPSPPKTCSDVEVQQFNCPPVNSLCDDHDLHEPVPDTTETCSDVEVQQLSEDEADSLYDDTEFKPDRQDLRCGMLNCTEDIFIGCHLCSAALCYDHMYTVRAEHVRSCLYSDASTTSDDDGCLSDVPAVSTAEKRRRQKCIKPVRCNKGSPQQWQKNRRKKARLGGKEYVSTSGRDVPAKCVIPECCQHGRQKTFRCEEFSEEVRKQLNEDYYNTGDFCRQRDFIIRNTKIVSNSGGKRKQQCIVYSLPLHGVSERVCKQFFLKTFCVGE